MYIEVPIFLYSSYETNILDKNPHEVDAIDAVKKININRIESYSDAIPLAEFEEENKCWTTVVMESGDNFIVAMPMRKFEKLIQSAQPK